jgi:hypothetical protein
VLFLAAFVFAITGDPVFDAVFPHQGGCDVCVALVGGHGVISADAGLALEYNFTEIGTVAENIPTPVFCFCRSVHFSRAPPVA